MRRRARDGAAVLDAPGWRLRREAGLARSDDMTEHRTLAGAVGDVLARLGIAPAERLDAVVSTATAILVERGHDAVVLGVRHRELRLGANGYAARLLRADLDPVHAAIEAAVPGSVERIIIMRRQ